MPICKRDGFDSLPSKEKNDTFHDNEEVFFCEITKEIFKDYEEYFRHVMVINSTVWQCEATGRENLTYAEALRSELRARKKMEQFKDSLRPPVMLVIEHSKQSSMMSLLSIVSKFLRKRYFINEEVTACNKSKTYNPYTVMEVIPPAKMTPSNGVYDETDKLEYKLRRIGKSDEVITVSFDNIRRQRMEFTHENLHMFIKDNVVRIDGLLHPKPDSYKKYVIDRKISFNKIFIGKMPRFSPAKMKRPNGENGKKQSQINKFLVKEDEEAKARAQEKLKLEKEKAEKEKASLKEQMERVRREKQERLAELERQKVEKRNRLMEKIEAECTALLTKTDDLERTDQRLFPKFITIQTYIPTKLLGDAFMTREFMHAFSNLLSGIEVFRDSLSFYEMSRAFTIREVAGPLSDILLVLLGTIFDLQKEEEEECKIRYLFLHRESRQKEPLISMTQAARTHYYSKRHFSFKINDLPIDALTISEVLRLHLLSSGAHVEERADKWRQMYRNGYTSAEDPGLTLRMKHPHILRALKMYTIYNLPFFDIMRVVRCLISQILTYSSPINVIEDRMDQMIKARVDLRTIALLENRRIMQVQAQKRNLTIEYNQQCLSDNVRNNPEKKKQLEDKLNKKLADVTAQSERDRKKYDQQVDEFQSALFNFLVFLGMDRAYRKYYVLESMPGIFIEHPPDSMDVCLTDPPKNSLDDVITSNVAELPKNRKDLRNFLYKYYVDLEKKTVEKVEPKQFSGGSQENKENHENGLVNGLTNGLDHDGLNGVKVDDIVEDKKEELERKLNPTQYELYMCTGEKNNCIVHDERNSDRQRWAYVYKEKDIDDLIEALNPLGERESQLREQLTVLRPLILNHVQKCPANLLTVDEKQFGKFKTAMLTDTYRKYHKSNFNYPENYDLNEVMYTVLLDRILQFEKDIYAGDLGQLKVKDMDKWRMDMRNNSYDPQVKLQWGPLSQKTTGDVVDDDMNDDFDDDDVEDIKENGGKSALKPYRDPGEGLGDTLDIDSEDSGDEGISLHDSNTLRSLVRNMASALLQVEQSIERRFLKEPFGVNEMKSKDREILEKRSKWCADRLKQWEISLMESTSFSQVFLHLNVLHDSIIWARSTQKSLCQVCRRGSDPEKMLLCDECNGGTHMFCMKPKITSVPEGNWYCQRCVKRLGLENPSETKKKPPKKRKRTFVMEEEETMSDSLSVNSTSASTSASKNNIERRELSRRTRNRLKSQEIQKILEDDDNDDDDTVATTDSIAEEAEEEDSMNENNDEDNEDINEENEELDESDEAEDEDDVNEDSAGSSNDDAESVCNICSYEGSDIICCRCKNTFHLDCLKLKRPPRYNFVCTKCKTKEEKKRKVKGTPIDDDDSGSSYEPTAKRSRSSRGSLRAATMNGHLNTPEANPSRSSSGRRSNRRTGEDLPLNSSVLYTLLDDIMKHKHSWPFLRPVSQTEVPDYYDIIKKPMDFAKVKSKLNTGEYQLNEEVLKDIQLIFINCDHYNVKGNEVYKAGSKLEKYVMERCKSLNLPFSPSDMNC